MKEFKIEANSGTKFAGTQVRLPRWDEGSYAEVLFIGGNRIFIRLMNGLEVAADFNEFELYEEPKKKVLMSPKVIDAIMTDSLYRETSLPIVIKNLTYIDSDTVTGQLFIEVEEKES